jgi:YHS domain-containing protein
MLIVTAESDPEAARNPVNGGPWQTPAQDIDLVCGKTVNMAAAKSIVYRGRPYYFCSQDCREKFKAAPTSYVKVTTDQQGKEHRHGCC